MQFLELPDAHYLMKSNYSFDDIFPYFLSKYHHHKDLEACLQSHGRFVKQTVLQKDKFTIRRKKEDVEQQTLFFYFLNERSVTQRTFC